MLSFFNLYIAIFQKHGFGIYSVFRCLLIFVMVSIPFVAEGAYNVKYDAPKLLKVERYLNSLRCITASFVQIDSKKGIQYGNFFLYRPGRLRWEYTSPKKITIIFRGNEILYHDKKLNQKSKYRNQDSLIYFLMSPKIDLIKSSSQHSSPQNPSPQHSSPQNPSPQHSSPQHSSPQHSSSEYYVHAFHETKTKIVIEIKKTNKFKGDTLVISFDKNPLKLASIEVKGMLRVVVSSIIEYKTLDSSLF